MEVENEEKEEKMLFYPSVAHTVTHHLTLFRRPLATHIWRVGECTGTSWQGISASAQHAEGHLGLYPQRGGPLFFSGLANPDGDKSWLQKPSAEKLF